MDETIPKEQLLKTFAVSFACTAENPAGYSHWKREDGLQVAVWEKTDAHIYGDFAQVNALLSPSPSLEEIRRAKSAVICELAGTVTPEQLGVANNALDKLCPVSSTSRRSGPPSWPRAPPRVRTEPPNPPPIRLVNLYGGVGCEQVECGSQA